MNIIICQIGTQEYDFCKMLKSKKNKIIIPTGRYQVFIFYKIL